MDTQEYEPLGQVAGSAARFLVYQCAGCGSVVHNMARHDEWHRKFDAAERQAWLT